MSENIKQIIVIRTDLGMRRGKEAAQCCHASMAFITRQIQEHLSQWYALSSSARSLYIKPDKHQVDLKWYEEDWLMGIFTKIVLAAKDEAELMEVKRLAEEAGLKVHLVIDSGMTEIPPNTATCLAIGPDLAERIDAITGPNGAHPLKLR